MCFPRPEELEILKGRSAYIFAVAQPPTAGCEKLACKRISVTASPNRKIKFSVFEKSLYSGNALSNSAMNICVLAEFKNFHTSLQCQSKLKLFFVADAIIKVDRER